MSVLDALKPRAVAQATKSAPAAERRLAAARTRAAELEADLGTLALEADETGNRAALDKRLTELDAARRAVSLAEVALSAAEAKDAEALRKARQSLRTTQMRACRTHLNSIAKDGEKFTAALADAVSAYQSLIAHAEKAATADPVNAIPSETTIAAGSIRQRIGDELYRLSGQAPSLGGRDLLQFPGAVCSDITFQDQPAAITPLADMLNAEVAVLLDRLAEGMKTAEAND